MPALCGLLILISFIIALPATLAARAVGRHLNALDGAGVKGQIKAAARKVPNTGGAAIFIAIAFPMLLGLVFFLTAGDDLLRQLHTDLPIFRDGAKQQSLAAFVLIGCAAILHIVGLIDDRKPLSPAPKLIAMLATSATVVYFTDSRLLTLLDARAAGSWLSIIITVLWVVVIINAFNFLDNMDGLSPGVAAICAAFFLVTAIMTGQWFVAATFALLLGALLGFLLFNFPFTQRGASIFMGDSGSLVVGFLIAVLSVRITYLPTLASDTSPLRHSATPSLLLLTPLLILAIPLYDFCSVCLIRMSQGKSPFLGDLQHFSHRLVRHGLSRRSAVLVIYGCTAITGIGAIALPKLEPWQAALVGIQTLLVLAVLALYEWARTPQARDNPRPG